MWIPSRWAAAFLAVSAACAAPARTAEPPPPAAPSPVAGADAARRQGVEPTSPLEARIGEPPATVLKMFTDAGMTATAHALTAEERRKLSNAFAALPPLHRRVLAERLRRVSFLDGMPNAALTSTVNPDDAYPVFDITIRAGVLAEDVSGLLTRKERTCFDPAGSSLSVAIEAGAMDAIVYLLLHEATHIVDASLELTPSRAAHGASSTAFTRDIWSERTVFSPRYQAQILDHIKFRAPDETLAIARAEEVYAALRRTPFASLYGSSSWHEDLAEVVTWYHLTGRLGQPYRIVIRDAGVQTFAYEPMTSELVRSRFDQMARFYEGVDERAPR